MVGNGEKAGWTKVTLDRLNEDNKKIKQVWQPISQGMREGESWRGRGFFFYHFYEMEIKILRY